jgi:hypothetical protein
MAWNKLGTTTLGSAGEIIDILLMITVQQIMLTGNQ